MPKISIGRAELDTRNFILYRYYDRAGVLLYVGITVDIRARENKHSKHSAWWPKVDHEATILERYIGERAVLAAETAAIKAEKPLWNDRHNEFVEVDDEEAEDPLHDFAVNVLSWLDPEERDPLLDAAKLDWDDQPLSHRERDIAAAESAVGLLWRTRRDLIKVIGQSLALLAGGDREFHDFQAMREWEKAHDLPSGSVVLPTELTEAFYAQHAVQSALREKALGILKARPVEEGREWVASAHASGIKDPNDRLIFAANYIQMFDKTGWGLVGLCQGPGEHGARCPSRSGPTVYFETCGACPSSLDCDGHNYWCERHAAAAESGDLALLRCNPAALWPIKRVVAARVTGDSEPMF